MSASIQISPSILSADMANLAHDLKRISNADLIHVDVMDGHFVPNLSYGTAIVKACKSATDIPLDVHLMVSNPDDTVDWYIDAGADLVTVHYEASTHLHRTVSHIKSRGCKAGVVLNPATPVDVLEDILDDLDMVLLMSVNPGFGGQKFIPRTLDKLRRLRAMCVEHGVDPLIEIDGGHGTWVPPVRRFSWPVRPSSELRIRLRQSRTSVRPVRAAEFPRKRRRDV